MAEVDTGIAGAPAEHALVDLIPHRYHPDVRGLLAAALGVSADTVVQQALDAYIDAPARRLLGFLDGRRPLGLIGLDFVADEAAIVLHLAVTPEERRTGLGRNLVRSVARHYRLKQLGAAGDGPSAAFFRALGFCVQSVGETLPGLERFECIWRSCRVEHGRTR